MIVATKKVTAFILSVCISLGLPASAFAAGGIAVSMDGRSVVFNDSTGSPFIDSGNRTLVPLRITMEAIDANRSLSEQYAADAKKAVPLSFLEEELLDGIIIE